MSALTPAVGTAAGHHLAALMTRLTCGYTFMISGWGKLQNLEKVSAYFQSLEIPWPHLQAPAVAGLEAAGGVCLLLGLFTRPVSVPLMATMAVAIATARRGDIEVWSDVLGFSEFLFVVLLAQLALTGAGAWSLDARRAARQRGWTTIAGT